MSNSEQTLPPGFRTLVLRAAGCSDQKHSSTSWARSSICDLALIVVTGGKSILGVHDRHALIQLSIALHYASGRD